MEGAPFRLSIEPFIKREYGKSNEARHSRTPESLTDAPRSYVNAGMIQPKLQSQAPTIAPFRQTVPSATLPIRTHPPWTHTE